MRVCCEIFSLHEIMLLEHLAWISAASSACYVTQGSRDTNCMHDLLNLCLTLTYFQYKGKHYKQLHGAAMGLPVSVIVAEIVMQHVEKCDLATCRQTIPLWLCYVDNAFTAEHKDKIDTFYDHHNKQSANI